MSAADVKQHPDAEEEYDVIIAGGGATGSVVAGRLAAAAPDLRILVLEHGPPTKDDANHVRPASYMTHLQPDSKTATFYVGRESKELGNRVPIVPMGGCLGGGSSINFMMYTRAQASDYDDWESVYDNPGWGSKDLKPLLSKAETYQVNPGDKNHGWSGPLRVSYGTVSKVGTQWLEVAQKYDKGRKQVEDANGVDGATDVYAQWAKWIDQKSGKRQDVPHHYIYPHAGNLNLQVLTGTRVVRVLFEGNKAVGVQYVHNPAVRPEGDATVRTVRAKRQVVVSCGALGTPAVLERSGVGSAEVLKAADVKQVVDLPGVGENYQDHQLVLPPYYVSDDVETLDDYLSGNQERIKPMVEQWEKDGGSMIASNGIDAGAKLRPTEKDLAKMGPAFQKRWKEYFEPSPDKPVMLIAPISGFVSKTVASPNAPEGKYVILAMYLAYPFSTGSSHIKSSDPFAPPDFDPAFLSDEADLAPQVWAYKLQREIGRRMPCFRGAHKEVHPPGITGIDETQPVPIDALDIEYTKEDDEAIEKYMRSVVATTWHSMGTCAMKPREKGGVVDSRLNVYGTVGLKLADLSICPANVGSNTYSTALVVGEKAALIIAEELGIKGV